MITRWQPWVHRIARALGWTAGVLVITLAVAAALAQVLLPLLARHPQWVAAELGSRIQRPIHFASLEGRWEPSGPRFIMRQVTIGPDEKGQSLRVPEVDLKLDFGGWLFPSRHLLNLEARNLELDLSRDADGAWHVNGIGAAGGSGHQSVSFGRLSVELWFDDLRVDIHDARLGQHYTLLADQLRVTHQGKHIRVGMRLHRLGASGELRGAGQFRDDGSSGRLWLAAQDADLHAMLVGIDLGGYVVDSGSGNLAVWMDWKRGKIVRGLAQFDLRDVSVANPAGIVVHAPTSSGIAEWRRSETGYDVRWAGADGSAMVAALDSPGMPKASLDLAASNLQLAPLLPWLALKPGLSPGIAQWLATGRPHGRVQHAQVHWGAASGLQSLNATFDGAGIDSVGKLPGVDHLQGEVRGDAEAVSLALPAQAATIDMPHTFRKPLAIQSLAGDVALWHADDAWHLGIASFDFEGEGYGGNAQGEMAFPDAGGRPFLDIYAALTHADIPAAKLFWPVDSMSPGTVSWLDQALVAGKIDAATVLVRGDLKDWPFHHNEGRFEAHAQISDLTLDYGKTWPPAQGIQATADFVNSGMLVQASSGQALGVKADKAVALIPSFGSSTLDLNVSGNGSAADMLNFVAHSPIADKHADVLAKLKAGGSSSFDFHLSLPLKDAHDFILDGTAQLKDLDLSAPEWKLQLDKFGGAATFDQHGFHAGPLQGSFRGEPSTLDLAIAGATNDPDTVLSATLSGQYSVAEMIQDYSELKWLGDVAKGRGDFTIGYRIAHAGGTGADVQMLSIDSPLSGVALNFPVPLNKPADGSLPLHVSMTLPTAGGALQVSLGSVMRGRMRLPGSDQQPAAATFAFGDHMPDSLPAKGMRIRGNAPQLDVTGWVKQSLGSATGSGMSLETIDVSTGHAQVFGRDFAQMHISATPKTDTLELDVDSAAAAGHFSVPTTELSKRGITARLQRLYWPKEPTAPAKPGETPMPVGDPADTGIDPAAMPSLHIWVHDLRLNDANLGEARLETWPTPTGMHIDELTTLSRSVQINAGGDWNGTPTKSGTHLHVDFAADNLGDMLNAFGYEGLFEGGKTRDQLNATWPGGPWDFNLATMDGTLKVNVTNGNLPKASPGVGRLFGLASIAELPRRLSLDFGDVFGKGFGFDLITGDFRLADGNAVTDNLKIHGPAAEIKITGRTGLRARDYDQQVTVIPHIGNSLPIVGAVVAGPVGAAAGLAVQTILGKGLNHAVVQRYHIGGSWDKPIITSGSAAKPEASAPAASAQNAAAAPPPATHAAAADQP